MSGQHASLASVDTRPADEFPPLSADLVRLLLWSTAFGVAALAGPSVALVVGVIAVLYLGVTVARGFGATLLGFLLVLAPDALVVAHVGALPVTVKLAMYAVALLLVLLGLLSRRHDPDRPGPQPSGVLRPGGLPCAGRGRDERDR
jgi:hypothetical protein